MSLKQALRARLGTTAGGGDFAARRGAQRREAAAAERKRKAAAQRDRVNQRVAGVRQRERARADARVAAARKKKPARRPARPGHDYRRCRDHDCERAACAAYRDGIAYGLELAAVAESRS